MPPVFGFDAETSSPVDLRLHGADAYTRHPETRCLMFVVKPIGVSVAPILWREGDPVPLSLTEHVAAGGLLSGWNVLFFDRLVYERILVARHGFPPVDADAWKDSMHLAAAANLPRSLDGCAKAVGVEFQGDLKDSNRIRRITDAKRTPIPASAGEILDSPAGWFDKKLVEDLQWLADRCVQDVAMEENVFVRLPQWPSIRPWAFMPAIDRRINDRGVMIDVPLVEGLARAAALETLRINEEMRHITSGAVSKVSNIESLKQWLMGRGVELPRANTQEDEDDEADEEDEPESAASRKSPWRLRKNDIADLMGRLDVPEDCRLALGYRAEAAKASTAKLKAMLASVDPGTSRLHGHLTLGGAQQTMRWCLAEGAMVLVKELSGKVLEKPIETVAISDLVWDGDIWVRHDGVVPSGEKEVIQHDNIVATPEHVVYVSDTESMPLGEALRRGIKLFTGTTCTPKHTKYTR